MPRTYFGAACALGLALAGCIDVNHKTDSSTDCEKSCGDTQTTCVGKCDNDGCRGTCSTQHDDCVTKCKSSDKDEAGASAQAGSGSSTTTTTTTTTTTVMMCTKSCDDSKTTCVAGCSNDGCQATCSTQHDECVTKCK